MVEDVERLALVEVVRLAVVEEVDRRRVPEVEEVRRAAALALATDP